jgi:hypothetical protein
MRDLVTIESESAWNNTTFSLYVQRVREQIVEQRSQFPFWKAIKNSGIRWWLNLVWRSGILCQTHWNFGWGYLAIDLEIIGDSVQEPSGRKPLVIDEDDPELEGCSEDLPNCPSSLSMPSNILLKTQRMYKHTTYCVQGLPAYCAAAGKNDRWSSSADRSRSMDSKFSFASDIVALGSLLWECCFHNSPHNRNVLLPQPLSARFS